MNVVRHDHEVAEVVTSTVAPEQFVLQRGHVLGITQVAFTQPTVQAPLHLPVEMLLEPRLLARRQPVKRLMPPAAFAVVRDAVSFEPLCLFSFPLAPHAEWDRVHEPERYAVSATILPSVRQVPLVNSHGTAFVERHEPRRPHHGIHPVSPRRTEFIPFQSPFQSPFYSRAIILQMQRNEFRST